MRILGSLAFGPAGLIKKQLITLGEPCSVAPVLLLPCPPPPPPPLPPWLLTAFLQHRDHCRAWRLSLPPHVMVSRPRKVFTVICLSNMSFWKSHILLDCS